MRKVRQTIKLDRKRSERGPVTRAARSLGPSERRTRSGAPRAIEASSDEGPGDRRSRILYWTGDERETTQGDW